MRLVGSVFNKYKKYLQPGVYELNAAGTCFCKKDEKKQSSVSDFATEVTNGKGWKLQRRFHVKEADSQFQCTQMLLTDAGNIVKCFDFDAGLVVSIFKSVERMHAWVQKKEEAKTYFLTSNILKCNWDDRYVVEELLKDTVSVAEEKWKHVLEYYVEHSFERNEETWEQFPMVYQHGDLWSANVFCDEKQCKVIDFDHAGYHMFFYDLALYMFTEAFIKKKEMFLNKYLQGEYDFWIEKICAMYGVEYVAAEREELLSSAIREMIFTRFSTRAGKKVTQSIVRFFAAKGIHI